MIGSHGGWEEPGRQRSRAIRSRKGCGAISARDEGSLETAAFENHLLVGKPFCTLTKRKRSMEGGSVCIRIRAKRPIARSRGDSAYC